MVGRKRKGTLDETKVLAKRTRVWTRTENRGDVGLRRQVPEWSASKRRQTVEMNEQCAIGTRPCLISSPPDSSQLDRQVSAKLKLTFRPISGSSIWPIEEDG